MSNYMQMMRQEIARFAVGQLSVRSFAMEVLHGGQQMLEQEALLLEMRGRDGAANTLRRRTAATVGAADAAVKGQEDDADLRAHLVRAAVDLSSCMGTILMESGIGVAPAPAAEPADEEEGERKLRPAILKCGLAMEAALRERPDLIPETGRSPSRELYQYVLDHHYAGVPEYTSFCRYIRAYYGG